MVGKSLLKRNVKWKVLILDSAAVVRSMAKLTIESDTRFQVDIASTIDEANRLEQLKIYDLIIVDFINHHEAKGLEFVEKIRQKQQNQNTYCIVLSNEDFSDNARQAEKLNIKAWLKKPFTPVGLMNAISTILEPSTQKN